MIIMGLMSKFNNSGAFVDVNTQDFKYVSLKDVYTSEGDKPYPIKGLFINTKGKFGKEAVAIGDKILINLPSYCVEDVEAMLKDDVVIDAIKQGRVGIKSVPYTNNFSKQADGTIKTFYKVVWIDL